MFVFRSPIPATVAEHGPTLLRPYSLYKRNGGRRSVDAQAISARGTEPPREQRGPGVGGERRRSARRSGWGRETLFHAASHDSARRKLTFLRNARFELLTRTKAEDLVAPRLPKGAYQRRERPWTPSSSDRWKSEIKGLLQNARPAFSLFNALRDPLITRDV
ncbi:hypothetical protein SKAU_G00389940 [Synaphobranchus kaupii]|uniref:Uncharacterized protein n=1 Tax=Synaphobranchus kaupii TaxID=118154 RepID=A0A9Q1EBD0_SYNKA|nr:hypothetical protein SKAU_G00389940 [Synaphobranchus kaupii]